MSQATQPPEVDDELLDALKQLADTDTPFAERAQNYLEAIEEREQQ